jgi:hypothetical protein
MAQPAAMNLRVLVVGLDPWGERVAASVAARVGHPIVPQLHVLAATEAGDDLTRTRLERDGARLMDRGITFLTVVRATDGLWIGPAVVPSAPGCTHCWQARRRQHAELLRAADRAQRAGGWPWCSLAGADVTLAARAILAVGRRLVRAPDREAGVVRRFRDPGPAKAPVETGRVIPVAGCARCDPRLPRSVAWSAMTDHMARSTATG